MINFSDAFARYNQIDEQPNKDDLIIEKMGLKAYLEKAVEALDILKKKRVNIQILVVSVSVKDYNSWISEAAGANKLTIEEFDLLQSIL